MSACAGTLGAWMVVVGVAEPVVDSPAADAVALAWEAPPTCADEAAVRRGLAAYLGAGPSREAGAAVRAEARVTAEGEGLRLSLRTETDSGVTTRETIADDCTVLVDATALIIAIAVDPSTVVGRAPVPPAPVEPEPVVVEEAQPAEPATSRLDEVETEPALAPEPAPIVPADPAPPRPPRFAMRASAGIDAGVLPRLAGGLRLAGAVLGRGWRAELSGDYWFPRTTFAEPDVGGRVAAWNVGARGCGVPRVAALGLEFPLCGGLEAGAMRGDPVGDRVTSPETSRQPWVAADASAGLAWAPRRFIAVVVQAELVVPIVRAGFRVGDVQVHRAGPVGGRGLAGLEVRFP